jgi:hypothetical protein
VLVQEELAQPGGVGRWANPHPVQRFLEPAVGPVRHKPVIGRGVVKFPPTEDLVKVLLVVPEDRDVDILVGTRLAPYPEVQRPAPPLPTRAHQSCA